MTFRLTLKNAPAGEPVSLAEAKKHLNVVTADDDDYIESLVVAARQHSESVLKRALISQTWNYYLDSFPSVIELPKPPLRSVTSIKYIDNDGDEQTLGSSIYTVDIDAEPGQVYLAYNQSWPTLQSIVKSVNVEYIAGYGNSAAVPSSIKAAILLLVGNLYENRELTISGTIITVVPNGYDSLLWPHRVLSA